MNDFERLFNQIEQTAADRAYLYFHQKRFKNLYKIIYQLKPENLLDIGESDFTRILKLGGYKVTVLNKKDCNLETDSLPYPDNFFDLVIYTEVIEHLQKNYQGSLDEIYRVIKPKKFILFSTPNRHALWKFFLPDRVNKEHIKEFTMKECLMMLKTAGFSIIFNQFMTYLTYSKNYYFIDFTKFRPIYSLYHSVVNFIPKFRESILILASKK